MDRVKDAILDYETLTTGRYYSEQQKYSLLDLVASANMLHKPERDALQALIFSSELEEYDTEINCANGILMLAAINETGYKKEILKCRKKVIASLDHLNLWDGRAEWMRFLHSRSSDFVCEFEKAIYAYSVNNVERATAILKQFAEQCHNLSVKLSTALCRLRQDEIGEANYLILLERITEKLYDNELPEEFGVRLQELLKKIPQEIVARAVDIELVYFDETAKIGF